MPAVTSAEPAATEKIQLGVAFLPMSLGKFKSVYGGMPSKPGCRVGARRRGTSVGYEVVRGLTVGIAPQVLFNVASPRRPQSPQSGCGDEADAMVRVA